MFCLAPVPKSEGLSWTNDFSLGILSPRSVSAVERASEAAGTLAYTVNSPPPVGNWSSSEAELSANVVVVPAPAGPGTPNAASGRTSISATTSVYRDVGAISIRN
jgi:hypothetical protein